MGTRSMIVTSNNSRADWTPFGHEVAAAALIDRSSRVLRGA